MTTTHPGTALVTGASSGIGAIYADRLAQQGYDLVLVARNGGKLQRLAARIAASTGRKAGIVVADLTRDRDLARVESVLRHDPEITMLVNNAGIGSTAPMLQSDVESLEKMIALNVGAPTRLAHAAAVSFAARGHGTIVNIASIVAVAPELLNGVYGGTKAFVLALSQALHHELAGRGVRIQAVLPGATATDFWSAAGTPVTELPEGMVMGAEAMVDAALAGLHQGEVVTIPSLPESKDWDAFEAARRALLPGLSRSAPAARYASRAEHPRGAR